MRKILIILLIIKLTRSILHASFTQGQCQAVCLKEYGTRKDFLALDGSLYCDVDVINNSDFALCKLGCASPQFNELKLAPFIRGQEAYLTVVSQSVKRASSLMVVSKPMRNLTLLCANRVENNGSVFWRVELDVRNESIDGMLVHWVEAVRRNNSNVPTETVVFSTWVYASYVDFFGVVDVKNSSVQFRATSFNASGYIGGVVKSQWYNEHQIIGGNHIQMRIADEMWRDELAAARISLKSSGIPSCSLVLSYNSHMAVEQRMEFVMDRSRGFLLDRLAFDYAYTLRLWHIGAVSTDFSSLQFRTSTCLRIVNDPSLCAPPPVSDISWVWDSDDGERNRVVLSWIYGSTDQTGEDGSQEGRHKSLVSNVTTFSRMVHFDIAINPLVTVSQYQCQFLDGQRRVVTSTHRSVIIYVPNEHCNYGVEITVVDSRNRRSTTTKTQMIRYDEKYQMFLAGDGSTTGVMVLSLVILTTFVTVSVCLVACRIKDRREWNTIKRSISPRSTNITTRTTSASMLGQSDKYCNEYCSTRTANMVRLSFSGDSERTTNSPPVINKNSNHDKSIGGHLTKSDLQTDEAVYDTIETPGLMHLCLSGRCDGRCLGASVITSVSSIRLNILIVPLECLIVSRRASRSVFPLWAMKHVVWPDTDQTFAIKYSRHGIGHLRREFKILSHISMNHSNLVKWFGVGICSGKVLSLLFEPCGGGILSSFLDDARKSLSHRASNNSLSNEYLMHSLAFHLHRFALNIAQALIYLHDQHCNHLHITVDNVYLALDYCDALDIPCDQTVKVGDFCWAAVPRVKCTKLPPPKSLLPPEGLIGEEGNATTVDIWQYGLLLAAMVTLNSSKPLLDLPQDIVLIDRFIKNYYTCLSSGIRRFDPYVSSLKSKILMCLASNAQNRADMKRMEKEIIELNFSSPTSTPGTNSVLV